MEDSCANRGILWLWSAVKIDQGSSNLEICRVRKTNYFQTPDIKSMSATSSLFHDILIKYILSGNFQSMLKCLICDSMSSLKLGGGKCPRLKQRQNYNDSHFTNLISEKEKDVWQKQEISFIIYEKQYLGKILIKWMDLFNNISTRIK